MGDGKTRLILATFVTTWMEPEADRLMAECLDKNMIDKDEYPQTAELEVRCVNMLARLWNAPENGSQATPALGCGPSGRARPRCSPGSRSNGAGSSGAAPRVRTLPGPTS
jgi:glutamate decarboxylase